MKHLLTGFCLLLVPIAARADVITFTSLQSNTIYNDNLANSNGQGGGGLRMDAGFVNTGAERRALLEFDIAAHIPAGSTIIAVSLQLTLSSIAVGGPMSSNIELHALQSSWGQGSSTSTGGQGAPAQPGDATWNNRFFNTLAWTNVGGDFKATSSASASVGKVAGVASTWSSSQLVADVQGWLDDSATNDGWILINTDTTPKSIRGFYTQQYAANASFRPQLTVNYTPAAVPEPSSFILSGIAALGIALRVRRRQPAAATVG